MAKSKRTIHCGCIIALDYDNTLAIRYCPKHEAAPELYEALKFFIIQLEPWTRLHPDLEKWTELAKEAGEKAIAKAEVK